MSRRLSLRLPEGLCPSQATGSFVAVPTPKDLSPIRLVACFISFPGHAAPTVPPEQLQHACRFFRSEYCYPGWFVRNARADERGLQSREKAQTLVCEVMNKLKFELFFH